jgi:hypothetical protein
MYNTYLLSDYARALTFLEICIQVNTCLLLVMSLTCVNTQTNTCNLLVMSLYSQYQHLEHEFSNVVTPRARCQLPNLVTPRGAKRIHSTRVYHAFAAGASGCSRSVCVECSRIRHRGQEHILSRTNIFIYIHIDVYVCMYLHTHTHTCVCVCVCVYVCLRLCVSVCVCMQREREREKERERERGRERERERARDSESEGER